MTARRYAFVGTGHRAELYFGALLDTHADAGVPVALCDPNATRMAYYQRLWRQARPDAAPLHEYRPPDFDTLLDRDRPDAVIVTSVDHTHADYICRALRAGRDVITEKPLTTDADGCRRIVDAVPASGRKCVVTFNYRYSPRNAAVKQLITDGAVGEVTSVHFEWLLDTVHGADYFRRWHRDKANSGGLLVHKATHHFDLVNWWVGDLPETVFAFGALRFYGERNAAARGLGERPARSHGAPSLGRDPFLLDLAADDRLRQLYLEAEAEDGYLRDLDVFSPGITIEDNLAVLVGYSGGAMLSYSLNAHSPWEGYRVGINGTAGRLELDVVERGRDKGTSLVLQRHWEPARRVDVPQSAGDQYAGDHGGGDALLLDDLFRPGAQADPLGRSAGYLDGVRSVLVGVAANRAFAAGRVVRLAEFGIDLAPAAHPVPVGSAR